MRPTPAPDADPLRQLEAELRKVVPSPEFAARVRERLAGAPAGWRVRFWATLACTAALMVAVLVVARRPAMVAPPTSVVELSSTPRPEATALGADTRPPVSRSKPAARSQPEPRVYRVPDVEPQFEVITTQAAALAEMWRVASRHVELRGDVPPPAVSVDADGTLRIPDIVVDPIVVAPIGAPAGGQGRIQRVMSPQAAGSPR